MDASSRERQLFAEMFGELSPRVYAYARRRTDAATAQDVVGETFLVAWRRRDQLPDEPLPWLLAVARNVTRNRGRRLVRDAGLVAVLGNAQVGSTDSAETDVIERQMLFEALAALSERDREALLLVSWDGLSAAQAARVLGCSTNAFEVRLSRARAKFTGGAVAPVPRTTNLPTKA